MHRLQLQFFDDHHHPDTTECPKKTWLLDPEYQVSHIDRGALKTDTKTRIMGLKIFRNILHVSKNTTIFQTKM